VRLDEGRADAKDKLQHRVWPRIADEDLRSRLIQAGQQLVTSPISDLMDLLVRVRPTAAYPTTHPGIQ
jgi:2-methylcitrate dehydratase